MKISKIFFILIGVCSFYWGIAEGKRGVFTSKFQVGDCIEWKKDTEDWETPYVLTRQILRVGKQKYMYKSLPSGNIYTTHFIFIDDLFKKIACPGADEGGDSV